MAYLHEIALKKAIQKLYLLGRSDARRDQTDFDEGMAGIGSGLGAIGRAAMAGGGVGGALPPNPNRHGTYQTALPVSAAAHTGDQAVANWVMSRAAAGEGQGSVASVDPKALVTWGNKTANEIKAMEEAELSPIGGRYGVKGLEAVTKEADANAADRMRAKALIGGQMSYGIGGSDPRLGQ